MEFIAQKWNALWTGCEPAVPRGFSSGHAAFDYAQKFWEAGNSVVVLMFGLAFGVYLFLVQYPDQRYLVAKYFRLLLGFALLGNFGLYVLLRRLMVHECRIVSEAADPTLTEAVESAFEMRAVLLMVNTFMYLLVLFIIRRAYRRSEPEQARWRRILSARSPFL